jgi:Zinc finger, C2H2 type
VHSNERPFPCHYCTQTFKSSSNRSKHERRIHEAERKASKLAAAAAVASADTAEEDKLADQIEKTQSTSSSSKESTRNFSKSIVPPPLIIKKEKEEPVDISEVVHDYAGNRVFRCEYEGCTSSFRTRSSLKDHQKVHSDER